MKLLGYLALGLLLVISTVFDLSVAIWLPHSYGICASIIIVTIFSLTWSLAKALRIAMLQGIMVDLFSPSPFGIYLICLTSLAVIIQVLRYTWLKQFTLLHYSLIIMITNAIIMIGFFGLHYLIWSFRQTEYSIKEHLITSQVDWHQQLLWYGCIVLVTVLLTHYRHERSV